MHGNNILPRCRSAPTKKGFLDVASCIENKCRILGFKLHTSDDSTVESFQKGNVYLLIAKVSYSLKSSFEGPEVLCSKERILQVL